MPALSEPRGAGRLLRVLLAPGVWLERARGRRRLALLLLYAVVAAVIGTAVWWLNSLNGLPDIGDPFDVAAFTAAVPEDQDASVLYRQALARLRPKGVADDPGKLWLIARSGWAKAKPEARDWVLENREALDLWRRGTERPRVGFDPAHHLTIGSHEGVYELGAIAHLALLEAARLEDRGDMAGAWGWYRAVLRCSRHVAMRGELYRRDIGRLLFTEAGRRIVLWAEDPRVDAALLRRAVDDIRAFDAMTPPDSEALKAEYVFAMKELEQQWVKVPIRNLEPGPLTRAIAFLRREPDRSRRVLRLVYANWLAQCDRPLALRTPRRSHSAHRSDILLHDLDPAAPASARALPPEAIARWFSSAFFVDLFTWPLDLYNTLYQSDFARERTARGTLLVNLAEQLYFRERGALPPSPEALVGPYLDRLPDGYEPEPAGRPMPPPASPGRGRRAGGG